MISIEELTDSINKQFKDSLKDIKTFFRIESYEINDYIPKEIQVLFDVKKYFMTSGGLYMFPINEGINLDMFHHEITIMVRNLVHNYIDFLWFTKRQLDCKSMVRYISKEPTARIVKMTYNSVGLKIEVEWESEEFIYGVN